MATRGSTGAEGEVFGAVTPMPVPVGAAGVVLFGGSFDPPTRAHVEVGVGARDSVAGDAEGSSGGGDEGVREGVWLVFVPAGRSPFKGDAGAGEAERAAMLRLAVGGVERVGVWTDEIDRAATLACASGSVGSGEGGKAPSPQPSPRGRGSQERVPSYWVETVWRARGVLGCMDVGLLWFVIGADQAVAFHRWREAREILELARPIVLLREPVGSIEAFEEAMGASGYWSADELVAWREALAEVPMRAGSATAVREALRSGDGGGVLEDLLAPSVLGYIRERGLYEESSGG